MKSCIDNKCCNNDNNEGETCSSDVSCKDECSGDYNHIFLELADCAWMEVLKDKIKDHILATKSDKMTELARIISEANTKRWKHKMEKERCCHDFKSELSCFFASMRK